MIGGQFNTKPGMGSGAQAPLPSGGMQGGSATLQQNIQQRIPNQGQFNGNPRGVYNTNFRGQGNAPSYMQQTNLGRYVPPTMSDGGRFGFNSNQWNNFGGYDYNLPGSYGSPQGGGQFAPMPGQFAQYMNPNMLSGNTFGFGSQFGPQLQQMYQQFYGGMGQDYLGGGRQQLQDMARQRASQEYGQGRQQGGFSMEAINADPQGFRDWAAMALSAPQQTPEFAAQIRNQLRMMGPSMPPGKDGRPLPAPSQQDFDWTDDPLAFLRDQTAVNNGMAPMPRMRGPRNNQQGPMMEDIPAYDRPENRSYNMNALYQMMGGF